MDKEARERALKSNEPKQGNLVPCSETPCDVTRSPASAPTICPDQTDAPKNNEAKFTREAACCLVLTAVPN